MSNYPDTLLLIDNEWREASTRQYIDVLNPATGSPIGRVASASTTDLDAALAAAQRGFEIWRDVSAHERCSLIRKAAALVRERADSIARVMTQEQGKPLPEALIEVRGGADTLDWFANEALRVYGRIVPSRNLRRNSSY